MKLKNILVYLAFVNDDSKKIEQKFLQKLINLKFIYKVGNGYYCTDSGAKKAETIKYPEKMGVLLYHPTYVMEEERQVA